MGAIDVEQAMRNTLQILQTNPANYRNFGVYWWGIKAVLKRYYTKENLYLLGDYMDTGEAAEATQAMDLQSLLRAAFEEYGMNVRYNLGRNTVYDMDGDPYVIFDQDAGI